MTSQQGASEWAVSLLILNSGARRVGLLAGFPIKVLCKLEQGIYPAWLSSLLCRIEVVILPLVEFCE